MVSHVISCEAAAWVESKHHVRWENSQVCGTGSSHRPVNLSDVSKTSVSVYLPTFRKYTSLFLQASFQRLPGHS